MQNNVGRYGVRVSGQHAEDPGWISRLGEAAAEAEDLGFGAAWLGNCGVRHAAPVVEATKRITVATGITSIWRYEAGETAERQVTGAKDCTPALVTTTWTGPNASRTASGASSSESRDDVDVVGQGVGATRTQRLGRLPCRVPLTVEQGGPVSLFRQSPGRRPGRSRTPPRRRHDDPGTRRAVAAVHAETSLGLRPRSPGQSSGGMFWLRRKRFPGSYAVLMFRSRVHVVSSYAWRTLAGSSTSRKLTYAPPA